MASGSGAGVQPGVAARFLFDDDGPWDKTSKRSRTMNTREEELFIGIDVGTSGVRVLAVDQTGRLWSQVTTPHETAIPRPRWTEQNPDDWWRGVANGLKKITDGLGDRAKRIRAVGLTGQMHGSVFLDTEGRVIRPALLWNDQRTQAECEAIERIVGRDELLARTGNVAMTGFTAPKLLWLRQHEPDAFGRIWKVLLPKDYIRFKLTGVAATDMSDASGTLLLDVRRRTWADELARELGLMPEMLPSLFEGTEITGTVTVEAARATGLPEGVPVVGGCGDQAAGAVGLGVVNPGTMSCSLGTSGVLFAPCTALPEVTPPGMHLFCHAVPERWHLMGVMLSAGGALEWFKERLASEDPYDRLSDEAGRVSPGAEGLLFLPYLAGERTPHADPNARAAFLGLGLHHGRAHMVRAVMEGVAFGLRDSYELLAALGMTRGALYVTGGGARSNVWCSILASALGSPVTRMKADQGPAMGAATLAAVGAGAYPDVDAACSVMVETADSIDPDREAEKVYAELYPLFVQAYKDLKSLSTSLAAFQARR